MPASQNISFQSLMHHSSEEQAETNESDAEYNVDIHDEHDAGNGNASMRGCDCGGD